MARLTVVAGLLLVTSCAQPAPEAQAPVVPAPAPAPTVLAAKIPKPGPCATLAKDECGKWEIPPPEKWRAAIDAYHSAIDLQKQQPLTPRARPLATYLNGMHDRVHVWFADHFLEWLDRQRSIDDPLNNQKLETTVELAISADGHILRMGIVRASGQEAFDASALEAFARAAPFGSVPVEARSVDGNLWLVWTVRRDEVFACSSQGARPFVLR